MTTQMEQSIWARQKQSVVQGFIDERKKLVSAVAGRGFLLAPGFLYEFETGLEIDTKQKLSDISFKILSDAIDRDIKRAGLDYDISFKNATMVWELAKQTILTNWDRELIDIKKRRDADDNIVEEYAIEVSKRGPLLLAAKTAIEVEMERLRGQLAAIEDMSVGYEVQLIQQKVLTAQRKLLIIPILQQILLKEQAILAIDVRIGDQEVLIEAKEEEKIAKQTLLITAKEDVINKKISSLIPEEVILLAKTGSLNTALLSDVTVKKNIVDEKIKQLGYQELTINKQLLVEKETVKTAQKNAESAAIKVTTMAEQIKIETEQIKTEAKQIEIAALKATEMQKQLDIETVKVEIEGKQVEIDEQQVLAEGVQIDILGLKVSEMEKQSLIDTQQALSDSVSVDILGLKIDELEYQQQIDQKESDHANDRISLLQEESARSVTKVSIAEIMQEENIIKQEIIGVKLDRVKLENELTTNELLYEKQRAELFAQNVLKEEAKNRLVSQQRLTKAQQIEKIKQRTALQALQSAGEVTLASAESAGAVAYSAAETAAFASITTADEDALSDYGTKKKTLSADTLSRELNNTRFLVDNETTNIALTGYAQKDLITGEADINSAKQLTASLTHLIG